MRGHSGREKGVKGHSVEGKGSERTLREGKGRREGHPGKLREGDYKGRK